MDRVVRNRILWFTAATAAIEGSVLLGLVAWLHLNLYVAIAVDIPLVCVLFVAAYLLFLGVEAIINDR